MRNRFGLLWFCKQWVSPTIYSVSEVSVPVSSLLSASPPQVFYVYSRVLFTCQSHLGRYHMKNRVVWCVTHVHNVSHCSLYEWPPQTALPVAASEPLEADVLLNGGVLLTGLGKGSPNTVLLLQALPAHACSSRCRCRSVDCRPASELLC